MGGLRGALGATSSGMGTKDCPQGTNHHRSHRVMNRFIFPACWGMSSGVWLEEEEEEELSQSGDEAGGQFERGGDTHPVPLASASLCLGDLGEDDVSLRGDDGLSCPVVTQGATGSCGGAGGRCGKLGG